MADVKYPKIKVQLTGRDGNAMVILASVEQALRHGGVGQAEIDAFMEEAMSGDYDHLLATAMNWVEVH